MGIAYRCATLTRFPPGRISHNETSPLWRFLYHEVALKDREENESKAIQLITCNGQGTAKGPPGSGQPAWVCRLAGCREPVFTPVRALCLITLLAQSCRDWVRRAPGTRQTFRLAQPYSWPS